MVAVRALSVCVCGATDACDNCACAGSGLAELRRLGSGRSRLGATGDGAIENTP